MMYFTYRPNSNRLGWRIPAGFVSHRYSGRLQVEGNEFPVRSDVVKENDRFKIMFELPGMEKDKIKVIVDNDILTVSGEKVKENGDGSEVVRSERFYGSFSRSFKLPEMIEKSGISADYKNGLLEVILPLKEEEKPKQIDVKVN